MGLNPITALSEQLQKLINEHGSAAILRDHLALFKDQVALLEKKATALESEHIVLKGENQKLKLDLEISQKDNEELRSKIQEDEKSFQNNLRPTLNIDEFTIQPEGFYTHPKYNHEICPRCLHQAPPKVVPMTQTSGPRKCVFCDYKISPKAACASTPPISRGGGFVTNWR